MPSPQPNDLLLRMAAERRLQLAEARVETAARQAIAGWLTAVQAAILDQATPTMTAAGYGWDANAVDAANEFNAWRQGLDAHLLPTVAIVFGEAFQSLRRTDPTSSLAAQQQFMADVSDRLRIWPQGAFEEIRPDLLEALSDAATFEEMKDRIGRILAVDTQTRDLRAQISDVDAKLADPDLPDWRRDSLTARRAALWNAHDESLSGWEWKARRIARTECLPADTPVSGANITAIYRRHYEGDWIKIKTRSGREISGTPNHPVLTLTGWKGLGEITKSDRLVCYTRGIKDASSARDEDIQDAPSTIGEIFDAVAAVVVPERERGTKPDFHGDGREGYVDVLRPNGLLQVGDFSALREGSFDSNLTPSDERMIASMAASRTFSRSLPVPDGMSTFEVTDWDTRLAQSQPNHAYVDPERLGDRTLGFPGHVSLDDGRVIEPMAPIWFMKDGGLSLCPSRDTPRPEDVVDGVAMATDALGDGVGSEPGSVELDDVVMVEFRTFAGHVYNVTCIEGYFAGPQGIVTSNTHAAIEAGQLARARQVEEETGDTYYKRWLSTPDTRTRPGHVVADGQMVRLGEKFRVDGFLLDFPGDPVVVAPHTTINCRCTAVYQDIDAAQAEVQGPKGSLGAVVPGGRRFGPDDPDDARAAVEQVAADRNQQAPADQRGEDFGQVQPDVAPITPPVTPDAPVIDAPDDLTGLSDDQLIELMIAAGNANNDVLFERVDAEFDRRSATIDNQETLETGTSQVPDDLTALTDDQLVDLLFAASDADITRIETELDRRNGTGFTASALVAAVRRTTFDEAKHARDARGQFAHTNTRADHFTNPPFRRFTRKWPATRSSDVTPRVAGDIREDYRKWLDHRNDMRRRQLGQTTPAGFDRDTLGRTTADYDMQGVVDDTLASGLNAHFINDGEADDADLDVMADAMWQILDRNHRSATPQADAAVNDVVHTTKRPDATGADAVTALDDLDAALGRLHQMRSGDFTPDPDWSSWLVYDGTTQRAPNAAFDRQSFYDNTDAGKIGAAIAKSGLNVRGIGHPDVSRDTQRQIVEQLERMSDRAVVASAGPANPLARYWTRGEGLARWAESPHPYTTLVEELSREIDTMTPDQIHGLAANYYHAVFGRWPGHDNAVTAAVRRVKTQAGADRYKLPIGSIIVARDRQGQVHNFTEHSDHDLIELMESTAVTAKNPSVYEAAFTEWARRQPDLEPADDVDPGMREDDPTHSDQLDMLAAERDHLYEGLTGGEYDGVEFDDAVERYEVYSGIVDTERELAATKTQAPADDQAAPSWDVDDAATPVVEVEVSPARQRQWELMEQADRLSQEEGISYEEALGRVQGLDPEQVRRREFVRTAQEQSFRGTSFDRLVSEVHFAAVGEWQAQLEEATNGQYLAHGADVDLWSVNDATARKAMTPEAREWFDQQGGRVTKADLVAMIESGELTGYDAWTIQATFAANTNRHRRGDYLQ